MAYVDLNPIRAKITEKLEESNNTSIKKRLESIKETEPVDVQRYLDSSVTAISNQINQKKLPISLKDYIELVEWTGTSIQYKNKSTISSHIASSLQRLNLQQNHWLKQVENMENHYCHVIGNIELIKEKAKQLKRKWLKGISSAKLLYEKPN